MPLTLPALPPTEVLLFCLLAATGIICLLAACFSPFIAILSEIRAHTTNRAFYKKIAGQLTVMAALLGTGAFIVLCTVSVYFLLQQPSLLEAPYRLPLFITAGCAVATEFWLMLYFLLRKAGTGVRYGHMTIGIFAGTGTAATLYLGTALLRRVFHTAPDIPAETPPLDMLIAFFTIPQHSLFWPILIESVVLGCAAAGAFGTLWLLLMRNKQDYGRDYYTFALPYCARWALWGTGTSMVVSMLTYFQAEKLMLPELSHYPSTLLLGLTFACAMVACVLWLAVVISKTPMRHKVGILLAFLCLVGAVAGQVLIINKMLPSP